MYEHSRELYNAIRPFLRHDADAHARRAVVRDCEAAVRQVLREESLGRTLHWLFFEVRTLAAATDQLALLDVIERQLHAVRRAALTPPPPPIGRCAAVNRKGKPCGRDALPGLRHCPWHRHLDEAEVAQDAPAAEAPALPTVN